MFEVEVEKLKKKMPSLLSLSCKRAVIVAGFFTVQGVHLGLHQHPSSDELVPSMASAMMEVQLQEKLSLRNPGDRACSDLKDLDGSAAMKKLFQWVKDYVLLPDHIDIDETFFVSEAATWKTACPKIYTEKRFLMVVARKVTTLLVPHGLATADFDKFRTRMVNALTLLCCRGEEEIAGATATANANPRTAPEMQVEEAAQVRQAIQASVDPNQSANREQAARDLQAAQVPASGTTPSSASATAPAAEPATTDVPAAAAAAPAGAAESPAKKAKKDSQCCGGR